MFTSLKNLTGRDQAALRRAVRAMKYERNDEGAILVPAVSLKVGGYFQVSVNDGPIEVSQNRVLNEGLTHMLGVELGDVSKIAAWYVALFAGNVTPLATWTAANFAAQSTEFTNYTQASRVLYAPASAAAQSIDNTAARAVFTADVGGGTVYGAALLSASGKSATTGVGFSAARFSTAKNLDEGDNLNVAYTVGATST